ncbi:MAG TPA: hypothetical protein VFA09_24180 [Ktedonobacteraceae bacterium]|nr:hypothetical protein [Ktedonobacteraceae bacterium]
MTQMSVSHCDSCGLTINPQAGENCPRCGYPVDPSKEEQFLEAAIHDLQRVARYGGANLTVAGLIQRYQSRLNYLQVFGTKAAIATTAPILSVEGGPANMPLTNPFATPVQEVAIGPVSPPTSTSPVPEPAGERPRGVFSWRAFFADQAINIVASLGAFLILVGSLSFVVTTNNPWSSFLILFIVQAVFGSTGIITYRYPTFRVVAIIYTVIFALLVPLVSFSAYRLAAGNLIPLSVPTLVAIAAIYAAVVYILLAIYQRATTFAYPGMASLLLADLAIADAFHAGVWWWPSALMVLAFLTIISIHPTSYNRLFSDRTAVLLIPVRVLMYTIVIVAVCFIFSILLLSNANLFPTGQAAEVRYSILVMSLLLLLWTSLALWLSGQTKWTLLIAYLFLASVLAFCYALGLQPIGYTLALTGLALFYHGISRFANRRLQPFGLLSIGLDQLALVLAFILPFIASPWLLFQLLFRAYGVSTDAPFVFKASWQTVAELLAVGCGLLLTVSITFRRAGLRKTPVKAAWCWLLLLTGFLLTCEYSIVVLALNITPAWPFFGLALVLVASTVFVRRRIGAAWANPLDVAALIEMVFTLILSLTLNENAIITLLLLFAALTYAVLIYQRRSEWLFLPLVFAILALPPLESRPIVMLVMGVVLPPASVAVRRFISERRNVSQPGQTSNMRLTGLWEWPLLGIALLYSIVFSIHDIYAATSTVQEVAGLAFPVGVEIALLALSWYGSAAAARVKVWLIPSIVFALGAVLIPSNSFWALVVLTPLTALLAMGINRFAGRDWALPLAIVAIPGAVMTGYTAGIQHHQSILPWVLLGYAVLALLIMLVERLPEKLVFPVALVAWSIAVWQPPLSNVQLMISYSLLCALIFASQYIWRVIPPAANRIPAPVVHTVLGIGGQVVVILYIIAQGGLFASSGLLAHVGAGALLELAILLFWYGSVHSGNIKRLLATESDAGKREARLSQAIRVRHWCNYGAGLLLALVVSWELSAFHQTRLDLLSIAPASYLLVVAPFLPRDEVLPQRHRVGQLVSFLGAVLLLLPSLWLSFNDSNLLSTLILLSEALALLALGIVTRVRNQALPDSTGVDNFTSSTLVYAGVSMIIVGAMRALFLTGQGVPVVLTSGGLILIAFATGLKLASNRFLAGKESKSL